MFGKGCKHSGSVSLVRFKYVNTKRARGKHLPKSDNGEAAEISYGVDVNFVVFKSCSNKRLPFPVSAPSRNHGRRQALGRPLFTA